jgi:hypothetical protein
VPQSLIRRCATEIGTATKLKSGTVRDILVEMLKIMICPNYPIGKAQDISFIRTLILRVLRTFAEPGETITISEESLMEFLGCVNALFSPAAYIYIIASASCSELLHARNAYLDWWRKMDAAWSKPFVFGATENSSLMPLAHALAPLIVPMLLPVKSQRACLGLSQSA